MACGSQFGLGVLGLQGGLVVLDMCPRDSRCILGVPLTRHSEGSVGGGTQDTERQARVQLVAVQLPAGN